MHAIYVPEENLHRDGKAFDEVSDAVDEGLESYYPFVDVD